jgi:hypothetical protein
VLQSDFSPIIYDGGNADGDQAVLRFGVRYHHLILSPSHGVVYRQKSMSLIEGQRTSLQQDRKTELVNPGANFER